MPAEWERHHATWIGWPHNKSDWPGRFGPMPWVYTEIVRKLAPAEMVRILVNSSAHEGTARRALTSAGVSVDRVEFFRFPTNRGGSIDVNGRGSLLTTEECLLDPAVQVRNPGLSRSGLEAVLRDYLGATNVLWLGRGIAGDDTHGHVDDVCRFVNPGTVVLCRES